MSLVNLLTILPLESYQVVGTKGRCRRAYQACFGEKDSTRRFHRNLSDVEEGNVVILRWLLLLGHCIMPPIHPSIAILATLVFINVSFDGPSTVGLYMFERH